MIAVRSMNTVRVISAVRTVVKSDGPTPPFRPLSRGPADRTCRHCESHSFVRVAHDRYEHQLG